MDRRYFDVQDRDSVTVLVGQAFGSKQLEPSTELWEIVSKLKPSSLIIDLTPATFISATLIGALIRVYKLTKESDGKLAVCVTGRNLRMFQELEFDKFLSVHASVDDALRAF